VEAKPLTEEDEEAAWKKHGRKAGWLAADGSLAQGVDAGKAQVAYFNFRAGMQAAYGIGTQPEAGKG
jgi:hypothetical protein